MATKPLPTSKQDAFLDSPLYVTFSLEGREDDELVKFFYGGGTLDAWCPKCKRPSVFRISSQMQSYGDGKKTLPYSGLISITAKCSRGEEDSYSGCQFPLYIIFAKREGAVTKIGQSPSAAVLEFGALDDAFDKELDASRRKELGTAIGLRAHGVGIGSFVYLRRIFEAVVEEAHAQAKTEQGWDDDTYQKARMSERLQLLHAYLPSRLVAAADLYGILSVGIHDLSDDTCLENFVLVKSAIELIPVANLKEALDIVLIKK